MKTKTLLLFTAVLFTTNISLLAQKSIIILLEKAKIIAKKEGKSILIKFEASWCGWCHKMTKDMKAKNTKEFFDANFVTVPVVVKESPKNKRLENPGGEDLIKKYNKGSNRVGLPFWIILDSDLKVITNSFDSNNQNLGGPSIPKEVKEFITKLKIAVPGLNKNDVAVLNHKVCK